MTTHKPPPRQTAAERKADALERLTIEDLQHARECVWAQVVRGSEVDSTPAAALCSAFDELLRRYRALEAEHQQLNTGYGDLPLEPR